MASDTQAKSGHPEPNHAAACKPCEHSHCDSDCECEREQPSMLKIMVEQHERIEEEIAARGEQPTAAHGRQVSPSARDAELDKFEGMSSLMAEDSVKQMIKTVAGEDTHSVIDRALQAISLGDSIEAKRHAFSKGLGELHGKLRSKVSADASMSKDPAFNLAMSLVGLDRKSFMG